MLDMRKTVAAGLLVLAGALAPTAGRAATVVQSLGDVTVAFPDRFKTELTPVTYGPGLADQLRWIFSVTEEVRLSVSGLVGFADLSGIANMERAFGIVDLANDAFVYSFIRNPAGPVPGAWAPLGPGNYAVQIWTRAPRSVTTDLDFVTRAATPTPAALPLLAGALAALVAIKRRRRSPAR